MDTETMDTSNETDYVYDVDESIAVYFMEDVIPTTVIYVLTMIVGITGNLLIIFTIVRHSRMRTITNVFLASLASADLLLILICVPVKLAKLFSFTWTFGEFLCKFVHYMQSVSAISSVLTLTSMSLERYYAILHPMKAKYLCTISQARKVIAVIWGLSFALATPTIFVQVHLEVGHRNKGFWCVQNWYDSTLWRFYTIYMLLLVLAIPACVMGYAYASICREVWQVMKMRASMIGGDGRRNGTDSSTHEMHTLNVTSQSKFRRNRISRTGFTIDDDYNTVKQVIKMLVAVVVLFIVCWTPLLVSEVMTSFEHLDELNTGYLKHMRVAFHLMAYANSCINPIVYGFMSKNFRKSFMDALCVCRHGRNRARQMSFTNTRNTSVTLARSLSVSTTA